MTIAETMTIDGEERDVEIQGRWMRADSGVPGHWEVEVFVDGERAHLSVTEEAEAVDLMERAYVNADW